MKRSIFELNKLSITKEDGRSTVRLFTASPTPLEEKNLGRLFAVMEIESAEDVNNHILDVIASELNRYYQSESFDLDAAFEHTLQKTNQKIGQLISEIGEEWLNRLNVIIGVHKDERLVFANVGRVTALMMVSGQIVDIVDTATHDINPVKVFNNVVSGELTEQSTVLFSTETILDYVSREKIKRIVTEQTPEEAIDEFTELLIDDTTNSNFAAFILQFARHEIPETEQAEAAGHKSSSVPVAGLSSTTGTTDSDIIEPYRADSMSELVQQQQNTEELLTSSIWPSVKKGISQTKNRMLGKSDSVEDERYGMDGRDPNNTADGKTKPHPAIVVLKTIGVGILKFATIVKTGIVWIIGFISNLIQSRKSGSSATRMGGHSRSSMGGRRPSVSRSAGAGINTVIDWFKKLSLVQKSFFVVAIVVLLIFSQAVINRGESNTTNEEEQQFEAILSEVDVKVNEGKAATIFNDGTARASFIEARDLLAQVPEDSDAYKSRGAELASVIASELEVANNVNDIGELTPVVDFASINPNTQLGNMILLGASLYTFDANNGSVYRGNLEDQNTSVALSNVDSSVQFTEAVKASPGTGVVTLSDSTVATFNPLQQAVSPIALPTPNDSETIVDVNVFGTRIYVLDTQNNNIFRYRQNGELYEGGESWITDSTVSVTNARSMAIDGSVYVLQSDGTMIKLDAGVRDTNFALTDIDPALSSANKLFTDENTENLYVLDSTNNRIVVFDKNGGLVKQITSPSFTNVVDMVVDEPNGKLYVLNGTQVFEIGL